MIYTITLNPSIDYIIRVPTLKVGTLNKTQEDFKFPGGKGINVSRILHRLDKPTTALGFLGGFTGEFIENQLLAENLSIDFTTIDSDSRINIKIKSLEETEINGLGPSITENEQSQLKEKLSQLKKEDIVVLSGSTPPSLPANFYEQLIQLVQEKKAQFVVDTTEKNLMTALSYHPLVIKPNNHELEELFQTSFSTIEEMYPFGEQLLKAGAKNVIISLGKDGALLFTTKGIYHSEAPQGVLKNSVGAGDSMIAGFVGEYTVSKDPVQAFRLGIAAGSATAFSDDLAEKETILSLYDQIEIKKIKSF